MIDQLPETIFNLDAINDMFGYVKWYLKWNAPIFIICMAVYTVYMVIIVIADIFIEARKTQQGRNTSDDDDDLEIEYF